MISPKNPGSTLGARLTEGGCFFRVWAPRAQSVEVHVLSPIDRLAKLEREERGYYSANLPDVPPGAAYLYRLDEEKEYPDPASSFQPEGVHGPSQVVDRARFEWTDSAWKPPPLEDYIFYELHVGTFTHEGTFEAVGSHLQGLRSLGVTAIELMPVAQFPGNRNWGYDGVYPFAVQNSYGGPEGLKRLVDACHRSGMAVVLDVVYNHLGPEGNYVDAFAPYFAESYKTPWGRALNFDGAHSDEVVHFFVQNALTWVSEFHVDALRLDAIHGIVDVNARPFLAILAESVHELARRLNRNMYLIAESDLNDVRVLRAADLGGFSMDAQWSDDFHHCLHTLLTEETNGYYRDFGRIEDLAKAFHEGFVYSGQYSLHRARRHGNSSQSFSARRFVVCSQNHDQVGNRMLGDRLTGLVGFEQLKLAAAVVLLSPFLPLLFMGEEYGESAPFQYFTSHSDRALIEGVRRGRQAEFAAFAWQGKAPDPQEEATFLRSKLNRDLMRTPRHRIICDFYKELMALRKTMPRSAEKEQLSVTFQTGDGGREQEKTLWLQRGSGRDEVLMIFNFRDQSVPVKLPDSAGGWRKQLDSAEERWLGPGNAAQATITPATADSSEPQEDAQSAIMIGAFACVVFTRAIAATL